MASIEPIGLLNGSAIAPVTMKQQAYELIKDAILYRRLQIGITYSQDALCSELNISRTPVREALLELQQEGYIAFMRGKGIQVIPVTRKRAQDIVEARYYLELSGARLAAQRRTAAQIEALEQLLLEQESRCHDRAVRASYQLDRKFHREIFLASGWADGGTAGGTILRYLAGGDREAARSLSADRDAVRVRQSRAGGACHFGASRYFDRNLCRQ